MDTFAVKAKEMEKKIVFDTIATYSAFNNNPVLHPLINMMDLSKAHPRQHVRQQFELFVVFLKEVKCGDMRYGNTYYDYEEGTLVFFAPGQVIGFDETEEFYQPKGQVLAFHPDFIRGTPLGRHMNDYSFFSYQTNEALHLSDPERATITDCFEKIRTELQHPIDKHSRTLIVSNIELLLNYALRYYDRQFITREVANKGILAHFETLLNDYYTTDQPQTNGVPSVAWCAAQLHISPNYLSDLVKKETGRPALEYIQAKVIDVAKEKIFDPDKSVSEVAYELGFKYPQHFTRLFKNRVGATPQAYRRTSMQ